MGQGMLENELAARGVGPRVTVESAGTHGFHAGKAPDELAQAEAASRGVDISAQRCREITPEDFDAFDLVLAMDRQNVNHLWYLCPSGKRNKIKLFLDFSKGRRKEVPDPYGGAPKKFSKAMDLIEGAARDIADYIVEGLR